MMGVMPPFAQTENAKEKIVSAMVFASKRLPSPHMADRIHTPSYMVHK